MTVRRRLKINGPALVFLTTAVSGWRPLFLDPRLAGAIIIQLKETLFAFQASLVGYVVMPSHIHLLLGLPAIERLSDFMRSFKALSSRRIKPLLSPEDIAILCHHGEFKLWRPRFDDVVIFSERQLKTKLDYIHNNPVKSGLVAEACEWEFSSAVDWLTDRNGLLTIDKEFRWIVD